MQTMEIIAAPKVYRTGTNAVKTTKHTLWTFVPMRVMKELTKSYNLFFAVLCIIVMVPDLTPFSSVAYIACIGIVVSSNNVKTGISEIKRYMADNVTNSEMYTVIRKEGVQSIERQNINPGDILMMESGRILPVSMVLLGAYGGSGTALSQVYVETSSINGESTLKIKSAVYSICEHGAVTEYDVDAVQRIKEVHVEKGTWNGTILAEDSDNVAITEKNVVVRGASIHGKVVAVGYSLGGKQESADRRIKNSIFMKILSQKTLVLITMYMSILVLASYTSCKFIVDSVVINTVYGGTSMVHVAIKNFAANVIIFSSLVPLSLFVTLDGLRIAYSVYINCDTKMMYDDKMCESNTYGVIEDIGLLKHILTDKTGTLTKNEMVYKGMHIRSRSTLSLFDEVSIDDVMQYDYGVLNVLALMVCNAVDIIDNEYTGVSQEELAVLNVYKTNGIEMTKRQGSVLTIQMKGEVVMVSVICQMDFTSALSRMGVLVRIQNTLFVFVKGAEEVVNNNGALQPDGKYRVLTVAAAEVTVEDVLAACNVTMNSDGTEQKEAGIGHSIEKYKNVDILSMCSMESKHTADETLLASLSGTELDGMKVIKGLEHKTQYIGTVYIEDALQDDVKDTVDKIKQQSIRIWMITGDRKESAISCGVSTGIFESNNKVVSAKHAIQMLSESTRAEQSDLAQESGIIVYRASPEDKRAITHMLRKMGGIVLSIGDGENDVHMIEEADIGVCVIGKEGKKAAFVSDIIVPSFSALSRLVLYHGCVCLQRLKSVYFFYAFKSTASAACQCLYGMSVGSSGSIACSALFMLYYNALITAPLSLDVGLFRSQCVVQSLSEAMLTGLLYGCASFFIVYSAFTPLDVVDASGTLASHSIVGRMFSMCIFVSTLMHYIFSADSFVAVSPLMMLVSIVFFVLSMGLDGGFVIFAYPFVYLILVFMVIAGISIERFIRLLRHKYAGGSSM